MPRIAGVDIPERKKIRYSLRYIYGIGPKFADDILAEAEIDPNRKAKDLSDQEVARRSRTIIDTNYIVEGALRRQVQQNVQRLRDIRSVSRRSSPSRSARAAVSARGATPVPARVARRRSPARRA